MTTSWSSLRWLRLRKYFPNYSLLVTSFMVASSAPEAACHCRRSGQAGDPDPHLWWTPPPHTGDPFSPLSWIPQQDITVSHASLTRPAACHQVQPQALTLPLPRMTAGVTPRRPTVHVSLHLANHKESDDIKYCVDRSRWWGRQEAWPWPSSDKKTCRM